MLLDNNLKRLFMLKKRLFVLFVSEVILEIQLSSQIGEMIIYDILVLDDVNDNEEVF